MQIAICDDDDRCCSLIEGWLNEYSLQNIMAMDIAIYNTAERLYLDLVDHVWFDVIFLDIELPGATGIQVANKIREELQNDQTGIVYISGKTCYCIELFDTQPFNFHVKPLDKDLIYKDIERIIKRSSLNKKRFFFRYEGTAKGVNMGDICYICSENKMIRMVTVENEYVFRSNLNEIYSKLPELIFCRCHKSYIVNMNYVTIFRYNEFILRNQESIPIGRNYRETVKENQLRLELGG